MVGTVLSTSPGETGLLGTRAAARPPLRRPSPFLSPHTYVQLVQNGGLARGVQAEHDDLEGGARASARRAFRVRICHAPAPPSHPLHRPPLTRISRWPKPSESSRRRKERPIVARRAKRWTAAVVRGTLAVARPRRRGRGAAACGGREWLRDAAGASAPPPALRIAGCRLWAAAFMSPASEGGAQAALRPPRPHVVYAVGDLVVGPNPHRGDVLWPVRGRSGGGWDGTGCEEERHAGSTASAPPLPPPLGRHRGRALRARDRAPGGGGGKAVRAAMRAAGRQGEGDKKRRAGGGWGAGELRPCSSGGDGNGWSLRAGQGRERGTTTLLVLFRRACATLPGSPRPPPAPPWAPGAQ